MGLDACAWRIVRAVYCVLAPIACIGICLNTILLLTTVTTKSLRSTANILIGWCALFDIVHQMGYLIQFPILFSDYYIDSLICSVMQFMPELGLSAGAFCVFSIGIDRLFSILIAVTYRRLPRHFFLRYHFLAIGIFSCFIGYLMIHYWTEKRLICSMPSPFHGDALALWSNSLNIVNGASAVLYFITWQTVKRKGVSDISKRVFITITLVMAFEVTGWFISSTLINLSRILALPEHRPPFHYVACLFVNFGIAAKAIVYYAVSTEYRGAIRSFLGMNSAFSAEQSTHDLSTAHTTTKIAPAKPLSAQTVSVEYD